MRLHALLALGISFPSPALAQTTTPRDSLDGVMIVYQTIGDVFGSRLIAAFDSIPASRYDYRPTPPQQTVGYIAQHLEHANYNLCGQFGTLHHATTSSDSLSDSVKARWPKDTLMTRLVASLDFCAKAMEGLERPQSAQLTSALVSFVTDLAEHYSQLAGYMRVMGMVPPTALPARKRVAIDLPATELSSFVGEYTLPHGVVFHVATRDGALFIQSNTGGPPVKLLAEGKSDFFVNEVDAQMSFTRDPSGKVNGLVLHQYGRDRTARLKR
jgi:hypothetical protein